MDDVDQIQPFVFLQVDNDHDYYNDCDYFDGYNYYDDRDYHDDQSDYSWATLEW